MKKIQKHLHKPLFRFGLCALFFSYASFSQAELVYKNGSVTANTNLEVNQSRRLSGVVLDENGEPIIGASVIVVGESTGTVTDINGKFETNVAGHQSVIRISYVGYQTKELKVGSNSHIDIKLEIDSKLMEEIVVVGYGVQKKVNLSGSISTVDSKVFESRPVQNAAVALQGEMPGVTVTRAGGAPGSEATIRIRDISSINGGAPLILIDGAEGSLNNINSADIENISVLKDGNAAIYGARAADGVILVTTKSGKRNQKLKVTVDGYYSVKKSALVKKTVDLYQYADMGLEITDGSWTVEYTKDELPLIAQNSDKVVENGVWGMYPKFYKYQNWKDMVIGNGYLQNYNINLSGGGEKYNYLISLGYQQEKGILKYGKDLEKRYFVRAKSNIEVLKNLNFDLNLSYQGNERNASSLLDKDPNNIWEVLFRARSWAPMYNPDGNFYTFQYYLNPAQALEQSGDKNSTKAYFTFNTRMNWDITPDLKLVAQAIVRKNDGDESIFFKTVEGYDWANNNSARFNTPNYSQKQYDKTLYKNFTAYAEYKKKFVDVHDFSLMVGTSNESSDYDKFFARRQNFSQQEVSSLNLGSSENQYSTSSGEAWTINSFFARLNYIYKDKYIIEGNFRGDGSSRFHPDHRWGYFPNVSAAWRISEENFMANQKIFDNLKLRASYGEMGNQSGIGLYDYIQLINISLATYPYGNGNKGQIAAPKNMVSLDRTWETIETTNLGLDFSLLNNRLNGAVEYFWKNNKNMLIPITYPTVLGANAPATNNGRLEVKGWEVSLGWNDKVGDLNYFVKASVSDAKNMVVKKGGSDAFNIGLNTTREGYPMNSYFGYEFDGIIQNEQDLADYKKRFVNGGVPGNLRVGDAKYKDIDGNGTLSLYGNGKDTNGDAKYLGDQNPRYNFGLNLGAEYKGFDFSMFLQGVGQRTVFLEKEASRPFYYWWFDPLEYWHGKTWTADRTNAKYPAITTEETRGAYNYYPSTNTKFNAAYLRLKNVQFGYSIPKSVISRMGLEKLRVYFSAEDVFEIHDVPGGYDPENGGYYGNYPFTRLFSVGANIVF